ncbi:hypothetical protein NCH01_27520 [Neoasaia chiangmaiensis]|nr:hypothetical protein [Neoasaia chiangmaiensis]GEN16321.1 hypothetical protein NCH01_27520 [Neoasaia chiangmaiensis]
MDAQEMPWSSRGDLKRVTKSMSYENPFWNRETLALPNSLLDVTKPVRQAVWAWTVAIGLGVSPTWAKDTSNHDTDMLTDDHYLSSRIIDGGGLITQVCRAYVGKPQIRRARHDGDRLNTFTLRARCLIKPQNDGSDCPQYDITARGTLDRTINQTTVTLRDVDLRLICSTEGR